MHKHAEVIKALADDKPVEYFQRSHGGGSWVEAGHNSFNPLSYPDLQWRVKPVLTNVYRFVSLTADCVRVRNVEDSCNATPNVQFTFDDKGALVNVQMLAQIPSSGKCVDMRKEVTL